LRKPNAVHRCRRRVFGVRTERVVHGEVIPATQQRRRQVGRPEGACALDAFAPVQPAQPRGHKERVWYTEQRPSGWHDRVERGRHHLLAWSGFGCCSPHTRPASIRCENQMGRCISSRAHRQHPSLRRASHNSRRVCAEVPMGRARAAGTQDQSMGTASERSS
jgi:hypothetical protein